MKLCAPAILYLVLAAIALIFSMKLSFLTIFIHVIFIGVWTFILNWICKKGLTWVSWLLVLLPYLFMGLIVLIAIEILAMDELKAQGYFSNKSPKSNY